MILVNIRQDGSQPEFLFVINLDTHNLLHTGSCNELKMAEQLDSLLLANPKPAVLKIFPGFNHRRSQGNPAQARG